MSDKADKQKLDELEFLKLAKKRLKKAYDADSHNRKSAIEDLKFLQGEQWEEGEKARRKLRGRPCLQINVLPKYSKQVCGEMRKNKSQIKVLPVDSKADIQLSRIREGIIYNIEYQSNAESIYDHAAKMLVDCGYGAWRVCTRYVDDEEDPFLQEIYLERILNPFCVFMDPNARDRNFSDAEWAFVLTKMSRDDYEEEYGESFVPGGDLTEQPSVGTLNEHWWDRDNVTVAEYFYTEYEEKKMCYLSDGTIFEKDVAEEHIKKARGVFEQANKEFPDQKVSMEAVPEILRKRTIRKPKIKWARITGTKILEENDWAGSMIPLVLVTGEETNIEGKKYIHGLIRDAKDSQRLLNIWHTCACETVALAPKAPWIATARMIENYEDDYMNANEDNNPVMKYNIDPAASAGSKPERLPPGQAPVAIFSEIGRAEQNIKSAIGMYNIDVGDTSNEHLRDVSGKAITARQAPGDTATYIYPDNMSQAIAYGGKIINDLIPHIYDTERDARLRNLDGSESFVPINTTVGKAVDAIKENPQKFSGMDVNNLMQASKKSGGELSKFNDITVGKYDIVISSGPTFANQRAEAVENIVKIASAVNMNPVDKFFILHNSDFPGSEEYAEVIKRMIPPNLMPPKPGEQPVPPAPPTPQMQVQLAKAQLEMAKIKTENVKLQKAIIELEKEIGDTNVGIKGQLLQLLQELHADEHPADQLMGGAASPLTTAPTMSTTPPSGVV